MGLQVFIAGTEVSWSVLQNCKKLAFCQCSQRHHGRKKNMEGTAARKSLGRSAVNVTKMSIARRGSHHPRRTNREQKDTEVMLKGATRWRTTSLEGIISRHPEAAKNITSLFTRRMAARSMASNFWKLLKGRRKGKNREMLVLISMIIYSL